MFPLINQGKDSTLEPSYFADINYGQNNGTETFEVEIVYNNKVCHANKTYDEIMEAINNNKLIKFIFKDADYPDQELLSPGYYLHSDYYQRSDEIFIINPLLTLIEEDTLYFLGYKMNSNNEITEVEMHNYIPEPEPVPAETLEVEFDEVSFSLNKTYNEILTAMGKGWLIQFYIIDNQGNRRISPGYFLGISPETGEYDEPQIFIITELEYTHQSQDYQIPDQVRMKGIISWYRGELQNFDTTNYS